MFELGCPHWIVALALVTSISACDVDVPVFERDTAAGPDSLDDGSALVSDGANEAGLDTGPFDAP